MGETPVTPPHDLLRDRSTVVHLRLLRRDARPCVPLCPPVSPRAPLCPSVPSVVKVLTSATCNPTSAIYNHSCPQPPIPAKLTTPPASSAPAASLPSPPKPSTVSEPTPSTPKP